MDTGIFRIEQDLALNKQIFAGLNATFNVVAPATLIINQQPMRPIAWAAVLMPFFIGDGNYIMGPGVAEIYPEWFGATANGTLEVPPDDTPAINRALQAAAPYNVNVHFRVVYGVGSPVMVSPNNSITIDNAARWGRHK